MDLVKLIYNKQKIFYTNIDSGWNRNKALFTISWGWLKEFIFFIEKKLFLEQESLTQINNMSCDMGDIFWWQNEIEKKIAFSHFRPPRSVGPMVGFW